MVEIGLGIGAEEGGSFGIVGMRGGGGFTAAASHDGMDGCNMVILCV